MPNTIPQDQNKDDNLRHFVASRTWYDRGKKVATLQMLIALVVPIVSAFVLLMHHTSGTKAWLTFSGISAALMESVLLDRIQRQFRTNGANEQEMFDCATLQLSWPEGLAGRKPPSECTNKVAASWKHGAPMFAEFKNWYPPMIGMLPLPLARLLCQRCNCWWDARARIRYAQNLRILSLIIVIFVLGVGLHRTRSFKDLVLTAYAPLAPLLIWTLKEQQRHSETSNFSKRLHEQVEDAWNQEIERLQKEIANATFREITPLAMERVLQDGVYYRRRTSVFLPDWIMLGQQHAYLKQILKDTKDKVDYVEQLLPRT
jgi:hypothetical protein